MEILGRRRENPEPLPSWAAWARLVFRSLAAVWALVWIVTMVGRVVWRLLDRAPTWGEGGPPDWLVAASTAFGIAFLLSGLVWLAGEAVRGYRESRE